MKIDRMIGVLSVLLQQDKVTAPYLAAKFEVSRRTVNRDIEALCMAGIPIVTTRGAHGGISIMEGYKIDRTLLTSSDMQAILAGLKSLDSVSGTNRYARLMEKLSPETPGLSAVDPHILIDLSSWYKSTLSPKIEQIHNSIEKGRTVSFRYYSHRGESVRSIEPYYLIFQWAGWYVWGWCLTRQDFRLFKLNRMTDLKTGEPFSKRPAPLPDLSTGQVFPPDFRVKALVRPEYKWRLIEEFGADCFTVQPDGKLLFSFGFTDKERLVRYMVSFGEGAELLEPPELRKDIAAFAEKILKNYQIT